MSKDVHAALTDVIAQYLKDKGAGLYTLFCDSKLQVVMSHVHLSSPVIVYCWGLVMQTSHFSTVHCNRCFYCMTVPFLHIGVHSVADRVVSELQETGRYLVDVWS